MRRGGVRAKDYVLHINKAYAVAQRRDGYYYMEGPQISPDDKTWCRRSTAVVNCTSTECAYSKDELCILCLGKAPSCEEIPA